MGQVDLVRHYGKCGDRRYIEMSFDLKGFSISWHTISEFSEWINWLIAVRDQYRCDEYDERFGRQR